MSSLGLQCELNTYYALFGLPRWHSGKESPCWCRKSKRSRCDPWVGKIPCSRKWQPAPVFLPEKSYVQRSRLGYSLWGHKDMTEWAHTDARACTHVLFVGKSQVLFFPLWEVLTTSESGSCSVVSDRMDCSQPGSSVHQLPPLAHSKSPSGFLSGSGFHSPSCLLNGGIFSFSWENL